ncbi:efflux RND transporter periplasmic adaptor subunit [Deinococcus sp.]|uniref:efflux RND transporter periplasmic adaptor subunit n=1 Tax=Deinococcus sp. TaxID=47478 RepID=UPI003B59567A
MTQASPQAPSKPNLRRKPSLLRRWWLPALIVLSLLITAFALLRPSGPQGLPVNVIKAKGQMFERSVSGTGTAKAEVARNVNFAASGTAANVARVNVKVGDTVRSGQVLASLDTATQQREVTSAQAALNAAQSDLTRAQTASSDAQQDNARALTNARLTLSSAQASLQTAERALRSQSKLYALGAISDQDLQTARSSRDDAARKRDQAQADLTYAQNRRPQSSGSNVAQAQAALESARVRVQNAQAALSDGELKAPVGGVVSAVNITAGNAAAGSGPAVVITDPAQLYLQVPFDETRAPDLRPGQPASVSFDALPSQTFAGKVVRVDPTADATGNAASVVVRIRLPGVQGVKPGFTGTANVTVRRIRDAVTIPIEATLDGGGVGSLKVFRVTPDPKAAQNGKLVGTAQPVTLTQQDRNANLAAVTGLKAGDLIINTPSPELKAGDTVLYSAPGAKSPASDTP